jgi:hypothetical protein
LTEAPLSTLDWRNHGGGAGKQLNFEFETAPATPIQRRCHVARANLSSHVIGLEHSYTARVVMPPTNLLRRYGLARNPYTDRTAEKTELDDTCLYVHSDLHNFKPSEETYLFFGKRGSGKTTIRLAMQRAYEQANADLARNNEPEHFLVDLCSPGHMTSCLKDFQARTPKCPFKCSPSFNLVAS